MATVNEKMTAIADNIRTYTGGREALTLDDMASGVNEVYEAGKKSEYDAFWDSFQNYGNRTYYGQAFRYSGFRKIEPKHSLENATYVTGICMELNSLEYVGDFRAPLAESWQNSFRLCPNLVEISEIDMSGSSNLSGTFSGCSSLTTIKVSGMINVSLNMGQCPLNISSLKSIITHLKDYSGTTDEFAHTVTFYAPAFVKLDAEGNTSPNGNTWAEYIDDLKWNLVLT